MLKIFGIFLEMEYEYDTKKYDERHNLIFEKDKCSFDSIFNE